MTARSFALVLSPLAWLVLAAAARAQDAPPPTAAAPAVAATPAATVELPAVDDPLLAPLPQAPNVLTTWQQALAFVREHSSELRLAQSEIDRADGDARTALAASLPKLVGTSQVNRHLLLGTGFRLTSTGAEQDATIPDPATTFQAGVGLRQPILALGAWQAHGTALRARTATEVQKEDVERLVLGHAADAIVGVVTAERVAEISRVSMRLALSTLGLLQARARLGAASAVDVLRGEQEFELSRAQVVAADEAVLRARDTLGLTLGDSAPWGVQADVDLNKVAADAYGLCHTVDTVDTRADVRAAAAEVEVAERGVDAVDLKYFPTIDAQSDLSYTTSEFTPNGEPVQWTVGALLTWQLYDGGARYGELRRNNALTAAAREQLTATRRKAQIEVAQTERGVGVADAKIAVATRTREIAVRSAELAKVALMSGSGTAFDLVDAARKLREAEIDLTIKNFDKLRAQILSLLARANCDI